jgi:hypothetical protein
LDTNDDLKEALPSPPSDGETRNAIKKMKRGKATGATPNMLKILPDEAIIYIADIIWNFLNDESHCNVWHTMALTTMYKGK